MPRWQHAYERDYRISGQAALARPLPPFLESVPSAGTPGHRISITIRYFK